MTLRILTFLMLLNNYLYSQDLMINLDSIMSKDMIIIKEKCDNTSYSLCGDGVGQSYRLEPFILEYYDDYKLKNLYKKGIYISMSFVYCDSLNAKGLKCMPSTLIDSVITTFENTNDRVYTSKKLKKKVNHFYKKNNIKKKFDGKFLFDAYRVRLTYIPYKWDSIILPCEECDRNQLIDFINVPIYVILNIEEIKDN